MNHIEHKSSMQQLKYILIEAIGLLRVYFSQLKYSIVVDCTFGTDTDVYYPGQDITMVHYNTTAMITSSLTL